MPRSVSAERLVEMARRALDVDQKAADAARHDNPKTLSAALDVTESEICAHFIALARQRRGGGTPYSSKRL